MLLANNVTNRQTNKHINKQASKPAIKQTNKQTKNRVFPLYNISIDYNTIYIIVI